MNHKFFKGELCNATEFLFFVKTKLPNTLLIELEQEKGNKVKTL